MANITGNSGNNNLFGTANNDSIFGLAGNDRLSGRAGNDRIEGGVGLDTLFGDDGNDLLLAGAGNDILYGGGGRDTLVGGLGRDFMYGGAGADEFRFDDRDAGDVSAGPLSDAIRDFSSNDLLDLLAVDVFYFWGYGTTNPGRGGFSIWQASGNTYVTWNTFNGFHDIELTGFTGNPFSQIRWYEDDYLANVNTTGRIAAGQTRAGTIEVPEDADWFRITLTQDLLYTFDVRGAADDGGTLQDPYVNLYDANGNQVAGSYEELQFFADNSGTYFVETTGYGSTGTYHLAVSAQPYVDDYAGDASTTGQIAAGQARTGEVGIQFDHDWFRISLTEGETYTFHLRGQDSGSGTLPDPYLTLLDADGNYIDSNDDWDSLDSQIVHTAAATGTYFLDAQELGSGTGTYELSVDPLLV